jgi:hypothetical protein
MQEAEAVFTVRHEAYPYYELERLKSLVTLKMEAICPSETSIPTRATRYEVPEDIFHSYCCALHNSPKLFITSNLIYSTNI